MFFFHFLLSSAVHHRINLGRWLASLVQMVAIQTQALSVRMQWAMKVVVPALLEQDPAFKRFPSKDLQQVCRRCCQILSAALPTRALRHVNISTLRCHRSSAR